MGRSAKPHIPHKMEESRYVSTGSKYYEKNLVIYIGRFFFSMY